MKAFPHPEYIQFYPTVRCNQNCVFCFNRSMPYLPGRRPDMSREDALKLIGILRRAGVREIDVMGGEPFLLGWMTDFVSEALGEGLSVNISTNGTLLGDETIMRLAQMPADRLRIGVSMEGSCAGSHDAATGAETFARAMETLVKLARHGLKPLVKTVVRKSAMEDIRRLAGLLEDLGIGEYYLIHMDLLDAEGPMKWDAVGFGSFICFFKSMEASFGRMKVNRVNASCFERRNLPEGVRCAGGVRKLSVMPDGSAYPCNLLTGSEKFRLGNILEQPFAELWESPVLDYFRPAGKNECAVRDCAVRASCTGGCPAHYPGNGTAGGDSRCLIEAGLTC